MKLTCYDYYYMNSNNDNDDNDNNSTRYTSIIELRCLRCSISSSVCAGNGVCETAAAVAAVVVFDAIFY